MMKTSFTSQVGLHSASCVTLHYFSQCVDIVDNASGLDDTRCPETGAIGGINDIVAICPSDRACSMCQTDTIDNAIHGSTVLLVC